MLAPAQDVPVLTLQHCQQQAVLNYPSYRQYELLQNSTELQVKNLGKNYLPALNLNGQASYQSDVTKVPTIIPQFAPAPISKDWYKLYLDVSQVIWDGGATRQGKTIEGIDHQIDIQNLDIELYKIKEQVNGLYFSILLLQENRNLLLIHSGEISSRLKDIESAIRNGVVLPSNADILKAELLKVEQKMDELDVTVRAVMSSLSLLIGEEIPEETIFEMPSPEIDLAENAHNRLEFGLFELQQSKMDAMKKMSGTSLLPKFQAFGQAGLGRPAFDMLNNDFDDYYIIGVRMNWNFWNWNKTRNEKDILDVSRQIIAAQRDAFDRNISVDMENKRAEVIKYEQMIQKDQQILDLRSKVVSEYSSRLKNGVITATEYLTELNAESEARLNINIHKIQLVQAKFNYLSTIGQL
jgi:outer membrane protein TolC